MQVLLFSESEAPTCSMSARQSTPLQKLILFGNTGRDDLLVEICNALIAGGKLGTIDMPVALKVTTQIFRLLDNPTKVTLKSSAWNCLMAMCDHSYNEEAQDYLKSLEKTTLLAHAVVACVSGNGTERFACLFVLLKYASVGDTCCCKMVQQGGLLEAILAVIDSLNLELGKMACMSVEYAIQIMGSLLQSSHPIERYTSTGCRNTLDNMLCKVAIACGVMLTEPEQKLTRLVSIGAYTCMIFYQVMQSRYMELKQTGIHVGTAFYNTEQAVVAMQYWYLMLLYLCAAQTSGRLVAAYISSALSYCAPSYIKDEDFELHRASPRVTTEIMLRKIFTLKEQSMTSPTRDVTFVEFVLRLAVHFEDAALADSIFQLVWIYPRLKAVVEEHVGKYRYCAHPDCMVSSFVHGALRKCARCRSHSVWYCGKEHQIAHWPEHKLTCKRCNATVKPI